MTTAEHSVQVISALVFCAWDVACHAVKSGPSKRYDAFRLLQTSVPPAPFGLITTAAQHQDALPSPPRPDLPPLPRPLSVRTCRVLRPCAVAVICCRGTDVLRCPLRTRRAVHVSHKALVGCAGAALSACCSDDPPPPSTPGCPSLPRACLWFPRNATPRHATPRHAKGQNAKTPNNDPDNVDTVPKPNSVTVLCTQTVGFPLFCALYRPTVSRLHRCRTRPHLLPPEVSPEVTGLPLLAGEKLQKELLLSVFIFAPSSNDCNPCHPGQI